MCKFEPKPSIFGARKSEILPNLGSKLLESQVRTPSQALRKFDTDCNYYPVGGHISELVNDMNKPSPFETERLPDIVY